MNKNSKIASILMLLGVGGVAGHNIDDIIEKYNLEADRYPMSMEYKVLNNCISNYNEPISRKIYRNKERVCICTLEKTQLEFSYEDYKIDSTEFLNIFEENVKECI